MKGPRRARPALPPGYPSGPEVVPKAWPGISGSGPGCRCTGVSGRPSSRRGRGLSTFSQIQRFFTKVQIKQVFPKGYPVSPVSIGEHIRKKRIDCNLHQQDVAELFGVTESTLWNWEHGTTPLVRYMPKIVEFLGYEPFSVPEGLVGRLWRFKRLSGFTFDQLGEAMNRDAEQLMDWMKGRRFPSKKNRNFLEQFLDCNEKRQSDRDRVSNT